MACKKKGPGRPALPPRERVETVGVSLNWYERTAVEREAAARGLTLQELMRRKLLRGLAPVIADLRAGRLT